MKTMRFAQKLRLAWIKCRSGSLSPQKKSGGSGLAAVAMVKNECDIIELFVRINSRVFDQIYVVDHNSEDSTPVIVELLAAEGLPVELIRLTGESAAYNQAEITTRFVNQIARTKEHSHIMPLDADEFLWFDPHEDLGELLRHCVPQNEYGHVPWITYCPVNGDYYSLRSPLHSNFLPRNREPRQYHKVLLSRSLAESCVLEMGNHSLAGDQNKRERRLPFILQHVPVRSAAQISSKALIGSLALAMKPNRKKGEGAHWDHIKNLLVQNEMRLTDKMIQQIALDYATNVDGPPKKRWYRPLKNRPPRLISMNFYPKIGRPGDSITHRQLARVDWQTNLERFQKGINGGSD